jgi:hypothetical protein
MHTFHLRLIIMGGRGYVTNVNPRKSVTIGWIVDQTGVLEIVSLTEAFPRDARTQGGTGLKFSLTNARDNYMRGIAGKPNGVRQGACYCWHSHGNQLRGVQCSTDAASWTLPSSSCNDHTTTLSNTNYDDSAATGRHPINHVDDTTTRSRNLITIQQGNCRKDHQC